MHSHIGGGKVNIARMMLPEFQIKERQETKRYTEPEAHICTPNCSHNATPSTSDTGFRYIAAFVYHRRISHFQMRLAGVNW